MSPNMEFFLCAELERAEHEWKQAWDRYEEAWVTLRTAKLISEDLFDLLNKVKKKSKGYEYREGSDQYRSDVRAIEAVWEPQERLYEAAMRRHYDTTDDLNAALSKRKRIEQDLSDFLDGKNCWREEDAGPGASPWSEGQRTRSFYDPQAGRTYRFTQTWPPPSPEPPPRSMPPPRSSPPPRSTLPPRSASPPRKPSRSPPLKRPTPFQRPQTTRPDQSRIDNWFDDIDTALANTSTVRSFPQPPQWVCERPGCPKVVLGLCRCCLASLFENRENLKADRTRFHPDKFSRCPENARQRVQETAAEIFKTADALYREQVEGR